MAQPKCGSSARRIERHLAKYGIELRWPEDYFAIDLACLHFFPNHIEGVIDQVLSGGDEGAKRARAREQRWGYFAKPVGSLLGKRAGALREDAPDLLFDARVADVYKVVTRSLLAADMTHEEVRQLLFVVAPIVGTNLQKLFDAVRVCRERDARTVYYLRGVLEKGEQKRETRKRETLEGRSEAEPWSPPPDYQPLDERQIAEARERWVECQWDIELLRKSEPR
jgi:hypothetical protein